MKVLVATTLTQGIDDDDYHYSVEGELVWIQEPCDRDKNDPDGPLRLRTRLRWRGVTPGDDHSDGRGVGNDAPRYGPRL